MIGVYAPEFGLERDVGNVTKAIRDLRVDFPVAVDSNFAVFAGARPTPTCDCAIRARRTLSA